MGGTFAVSSMVMSVGVVPVTNLVASGQSLVKSIEVVGLKTIATGAVSYGGGQVAKIGTYRLSKDVFELTESESQSNAQMAEIFGTLVTGIAVAKPIDKVVNNRFGLNAKVPTETLLREKPIQSEQFNNWEKMKDEMLI